jgi:hypothetical protein
VLSWGKKKKRKEKQDMQQMMEFLLKEFGADSKAWPQKRKPSKQGQPPCETRG